MCSAFSLLFPIIALISINARVQLCHLIRNIKAIMSEKIREKQCRRRGKRLIIGREIRMREMKRAPLKGLIIDGSFNSPSFIPSCAVDLHDSQQIVTPRDRGLLGCTKVVYDSTKGLVLKVGTGSHLGVTDSTYIPST